ncbi:glycosyltransferase [Aureispira anguillae]|uniref:Glycosyltransferase n=1 Tax=Aureispira anguillae TaxID=2864201 RepID=A0A915YDW5_9BACT|nr:glycosyltransferase [Aureispira anguillae]BDS11257.1 glycosyltransferase [Aureispira anguillae]
MKKIYLTVTNDLTYDQRMIRIGTSLATAGYEVWLIGRHRSNSKALKQQAFQQKRLSCFFNKGKFFYLEYNIRLFFFLLWNRFDAVCSIDLDTILAGYYASKLKRKICIYDAHEYFTEVPEVVQRPTTKRIWEWVAQHTIPKLEHAYTVCESLQKVFKERYHTNFEVIRNVPFQQNNSPQPLPFQQPFILLYQGVLNDGRGLEEMIAAMQDLEGVEFWLAGEGDCSQALRALTQQLGLNNRVKFLGYVQPHELTEITKKVHLGINLLQNKGLNYYYSLANKFFDYIQAQKPSLNMNFPEYATIIQRFPVGLLLDNLERKTIVECIQNLVNSPDLYYDLQEHCKIAAQEFIWEKEELKLIQFYHNIWASNSLT